VNVQEFDPGIGKGMRGRPQQSGPMKICIVGAGAIGGFVGTRLALAGGCDVSALARGATLAALREHGWRLDSGGQRFMAPVRAESDAAVLGEQDLLIVAVKAHALEALAPTLAPLIGPRTTVLTLMNGVPGWFCEGVSGWPGGRLNSVDPHGAIAAALPLPQVLGGVVHAACSSPEPGRVAHRMGRGLIVGEPRGGIGERVQAVTALLARAGFEATASADIRRDLWFKLWGNLTMNPVSALTGATLDAVLADPLVRRLCSDAMAEAARIGAVLGCPIDQSPEDRHAVTAKLGAVKTSMLQDVEGHRPLELAAIVGAVHEMGARLGHDTPAIGALLGLTRLMALTRGLLPKDGSA
jgi:2-dehydropantoate 2-reductase